MRHRRSTNTMNAASPEQKRTTPTSPNICHCSARSPPHIVIPHHINAVPTATAAHVLRQLPFTSHRRASQSPFGINTTGPLRPKPVLAVIESSPATTRQRVQRHNCPYRGPDGSLGPLCNAEATLARRHHPHRPYRFAPGRHTEFLCAESATVAPERSGSKRGPQIRSGYGPRRHGSRCKNSCTAKGARYVPDSYCV